MAGAKDSSNVSEKIRRHLTCSICLDVFVVPKTLPCLHTFCQTCLREYIGKGILSNPGEKKYFECPLCRSKTYAKDNSDTKNWVEDFPSNHFIVSMIDDGLQTLDETNPEKAKKEMQCVPCSIDGKTGKKSKAFAFCTMCTEYLCKECNQNHGKFKSTRGHLVLTGEGLPKDISVFEKMSQYGFCDIHNQKEIEFKCLDHDRFICSLCVASSHRKCDYLVHVDKIDSENNTTFQENVDKILALKMDVELALSSKLEEAERLDTEEVRIDNKKRELINILKKEIRHLETDFTETYRQLIKEEKKRLSVSISESAGLIDTIKSLGEFATVVLKHGSKYQMTILCDELRSRESSISSCIDSKGSTVVATLEKCVLTEISKIRSKLTKLCGYEVESQSSTNTGMEAAELVGKETTENWDLLPATDKIQTNKPTTNDGKYSVNEKLDRSVRRKLVSEDNLTAIGKKLDKTPLLVSEVCKIKTHDLSVEITGVPSKVCNHNGSLLRHDGSMVFLDKNNQVMKLFDPEYKLLSYTVLEADPLDVISLQKDKVGVVTSSSFCIYTVNKNVFKKYAFHKTNAVLLSVGQLDQDLVFLCSDSSNKKDSFLRITDQETQLIKEIRSFCIPNGKPHKLYDSRLIRIKGSDSFVICEAKRLQGCDNCGNMTWYFTQQDIQNLVHMSLDSDYNVYLCDSVTGKIHQICSYSARVNRILISKINCPSSTVFNPRKRTLTVGCQNDNKVHVYQFK